MSHFLKRLELNGFKSFANRTVLEFPAGIVAIVGPNGSGKSNIVDAVRWLLGERDAKNLRGGKGEDLIFAGTEKRARIGMASASLHFENKNKFFPVDFEEVVVMRQISRSGESKYFLNKSEILLRDLIDFFAKARLGARGLIIIGQGDSDLFIRSTPIARREMIEEILGLREYQLKRADAERRLKNTRVNLEKTQALAQEILPHLRSLKRQTNRWEKRGELAEELAMLENHFFGFQLEEIIHRVMAVEATISRNHAEFEALEKEKRAAEAHQAEIESSQPEEKKSLANIKKQVRLLFERRSGLEKDLGRLEAQIEMAQANRGAAGKGNNDQTEKLLGLVQKIRGELERALDEDELELRALIEGLVEEIDLTLLEKSERKPAVPTGLRDDLKKMTASLAELEKEISTLREKEQSLEEGQEGFYQIFKLAVGAVTAVKNRIGEWENRNREHQLEKERLDLRREELFRQIEQAGRHPDEFTDSANRKRLLGTARGGKMTNGAPVLSDLERQIFRLRGDLASIGEIDQALVTEAKDTESRYEFLSKESEDLLRAVTDLTGFMRELSEKIKTEFDKSLGDINREFEKFFGLMFGGGSAKLKVKKIEIDKVGEGESGAEAENSDDNNMTEQSGGVEIDVRLPRKKIATLDALSGGERSLVGIAALFAMVSVSPPPFLILDEIDAPLDERNARRFSELLREFSKRTQFVVVTHNRATMEAAEILYGVTLAEDGTSKVVSLKFEE